MLPINIIDTHQTTAVVVVLLIVRARGAALLCRPAGVEDQEWRHWQSRGILRQTQIINRISRITDYLWIREEHATAESYPEKERVIYSDHLTM